MPKLAEGKKRYSLALTQATMEKLREQFSKAGAKSPTQAAGLITLMVDDFLNQMSTHVMPVILKSVKDGNKEISQVAFMKMIFDAMNEIAE